MHFSCDANLLVAKRFDEEPRLVLSSLIVLIISFTTDNVTSKLSILASSLGFHPTKSSINIPQEILHTSETAATMTLLAGGCPTSLAHVVWVVVC